MAQVMELDDMRCALAKESRGRHLEEGEVDHWSPKVVVLSLVKRCELIGAALMSHFDEDYVTRGRKRYLGHR